MFNIVFYTNQFFANIGGEAAAYQEPFWKEEACGAAIGIRPLLADVNFLGTIVCGDNYYVENKSKVQEFIKKSLDGKRVDLLIAGPAFNAGRFGMACADVCDYAKKELKLKAFTAMYWENPAVEIYKKELYILETGKSAASMKNAVGLMAGFANKLLQGKKIGMPNEEGLFCQRQTCKPLQREKRCRACCGYAFEESERRTL